MRSIKKEALICVRSDLNIEYRVCKITHILYENEEFKYIFEPDYNVISLTDVSFFQGIPGLNLDLKEKEYIRENINPVFISERVPNSNREDLYEMLQKVGLDYIDPLEYLIRTKEKYSGDNFYLIPYEPKRNVDLDHICGKNNTFGINKAILEELAKGNGLIIDGNIIDANSSVVLFKVTEKLYRKEKENLEGKQKQGIEKAKENGKYKGRKPAEVDKLQFIDLLERVKKGQITAKEVCQKMNISIDKYYRLKKQLQN